MAARVVVALLQRPNQYLHIDDLVEAVYGEDADGGPLTARVTIRVTLWKLLKSGLPLDVNTRMGRAGGTWLGAQIRKQKEGRAA